MTNESELSRRLAATADMIDAEPDLDDVIGRSSRKRGRSRRMAVVSAAAVGVVGVGALVAVANRDPQAVTDRTPVAETTPRASAPNSASNTVASTVVDVLATAPNPPTSSESATDSTRPPDLADPYLDQTTVVFDEVMNDDVQFVVRLSDVSYGELFDIEWTAPTGSTEECLGGPAMIIGDPTGERGGRNDASAWDAYPLPQLSEEYPTDVATAAGPFSFRIDQDADTSVFVVRTQLPVSEVVVQGEGFTTTSAEFVDGVAAVTVTAEMVRDEQGSFSVPFDQATVTLQPEPSADIAPSLLTLALFDDGQPDLVPPDCVPTFPPDAALPDPGEQPADPIGAKATIRERFALAVDPTIPFGDKPDDLFDSALGIEQAIDEALNGPNAGYIRDARYEIVDLVFTSPTEAWFEYDLEALGVMFRPFGRATLAGEEWQISRNTICQDLAQAGAICEPAAAAETPPADPTIAPPTTLSESELFAYTEPLFCNPIRPCEDPTPPDPASLPAEGEAQPSSGVGPLIDVDELAQATDQLQLPNTVPDLTLALDDEISLAVDLAFAPGQVVEMVCVDTFVGEVSNSRTCGDPNEIGGLLTFGFEGKVAVLSNTDQPIEFEASTCQEQWIAETAPFKLQVCDTAAEFATLNGRDADGNPAHVALWGG